MIPAHSEHPVEAMRGMRASQNYLAVQAGEEREQIRQAASRLKVRTLQATSPATLVQSHPWAMAGAAAVAGFALASRRSAPPPTATPVAGATSLPAPWYAPLFDAARNAAVEWGKAALATAITASSAADLVDDAPAWTSDDIGTRS
jgi:ElaB/YqjD/DUF883 family membrane-anchored ribosome-binding protein